MAPENSTGWRIFEIAEKRPESAIITSFILRPEDGGPVPRHHPGQHLTALFPVTGKGEIQHNYTISCDANGEHYRISVKREPEGTVSKWLHDEARPGTKIKVMPPSGTFVLPEDQKPPVVLLSGGVGQTPMVAMAEAIADRHPDLKAHYVHCAINGEVHAFRTHIEALADKHGGIDVTTFYSDPKPDDAPDQTGHLTLDWLKANTPLAEADYFVCGPLPFLRAFVSGLARAGVPTEHIHYEFFGPVEELIEDEGDAPKAASAAPPPARTFQRSDDAKVSDGDIGAALLASASDAVVASDAGGTIILWNPGAERIFGFTSKRRSANRSTSSFPNRSARGTGKAMTRPSRLDKAVMAQAIFSPFPA